MLTLCAPISRMYKSCPSYPKMIHDCIDISCRWIGRSVRCHDVGEVGGVRLKRPCQCRKGRSYRPFFLAERRDLVRSPLLFQSGHHSIKCVEPLLVTTQGLPLDIRLLLRTRKSQSLRLASCTWANHLTPLPLRRPLRYCRYLHGATAGCTRH
jgi:hypothetical protein